MQRREFVLGGASLATAATAGCLGTTLGQSDEPSGDNQNHDRTIAVGATGEVSAEPDVAELVAALETRGDSAADVRDELADRSEALIDALVEYGLDESAITTDRFDIRRREEASGESRSSDRSDEEETSETTETVYYKGIYALSITVADVSAVSEVIEVAVDNGADTIGRVTFTLSEERREELREDAIAAAIANAEEEATFIADEIEAGDLEVRSVDASGARVRPYVDRAEAAYDASGPSFYPDDVTVSASVDVVFTIE